MIDGDKESDPHSKYKSLHMLACVFEVKRKLVWPKNPKKENENKMDEVNSWNENENSQVSKTHSIFHELH